MPVERHRAPGHAHADTARAGHRHALIAAIAVLAAAVLAPVLVVLLSSGGGAPTRVASPAPVDGVQAVESTSSVHDAAGGVWTPDAFSHGGALSRDDVALRDTDAPALYDEQRVGVRSISVPLRANGSYLVVLYMAEIANVAPDARVFTVVAQGRPIATVDVAREVGELTPYHLAFTATVTRHLLSIRFVAVRGAPILSAFRLTRVSAHIQLPARRLTWADEFNGPSGASPDLTRWGYDLGSGWGQAARYTDEPANASLDGAGNLVLAAHGESAGRGTLVRAPTSARITTQGLFEVGYGSVSARVRVAGSPGVVSTFWALGADIDRVGWPRAGEIDPLEVRGAQPRVLIQAFHMSCPGRPCAFVWDTVLPQPLSGGFHEVTVERAPGVAVYRLDGRQTASLTSADVPAGAWAFDKPFYLILNLIVGAWAGPPTPATHWPVSMLVDWVRAYT